MYFTPNELEAQDLKNVKIKDDTEKNNVIDEKFPTPEYYNLSYKTDLGIAKRKIQTDPNALLLYNIGLVEEARFDLLSLKNKILRRIKFFLIIMTKKF